MATTRHAPFQLRNRRSIAGFVYINNQNLVHNKFRTFEGLSTTFKASNKCFLHLLMSKMFIVKVTHASRLTIVSREAKKKQPYATNE